MIAHFDHMTAAVAELTPALTHYEALFGRPPVWQGRHPSLGTESALFSLENAMVELTAPLPGALESEGLRAHLAAAGEGLVALALGTLDADACHAALKAKGVRAAPPARDEAEGAGGARRSYAAVEVSPRQSRGVPLLVVERSDTAALRAGAGSVPSGASALDHVVVRTADLPAARAFYGEQLGLRLALDTELGGIGMLFFRVGGVTVEVVHDPGAGATDSLWGVAYRVRDIDAAQLRMASAGLEPSAVRDGKKPGTRVFTLPPLHGVRTLVLSDPARA
jgi:catechol 2,3-dioxygenase-like lactoylglutathione lyase family enzyme